MKKLLSLCALSVIFMNIRGGERLAVYNDTGKELSSAVVYVGRGIVGEKGKMRLREWQPISKDPSRATVFAMPGLSPQGSRTFVVSRTPFTADYFNNNPNISSIERSRDWSVIRIGDDTSSVASPKSSGKANRLVVNERGLMGGLNIEELTENYQSTHR